MSRSARLDGEIFRALRDDTSANRQAVVVLAISGLSFGLGFTFSIRDDLFGIALGGLIGIGVGILTGFLWISLTYLIVTKVFKGSSDFWSLARPVFFASSPGLLFLLMLIPAWPVSEIARVMGVIWIALSNVVAVKNAMGWDNQRSLVTFTIVAFILVILYGLVISL